MDSTEITVQNKKFAVLGGGRSGSAAARLLLKHGAYVLLSDSTISSDLKNTCDAIAQQNSERFEFELAHHSDKIFEYSDACIVSPGIRLNVPIIAQTRERDIPVYGELELASRFCTNPLIAVTGTNGKSTVVMMLDSIFDSAEKPRRVAGNIGNTFADEVDDLELDETVILEVSSFQLETIETFHPNTAVILNISPDHVYRHNTMEDYISSKLRIGENQTEEDVLIFNHNDPYLQKITASGRATRWWFDNEHAVDRGAGVRNDTLYLYDSGKEKEILPIRELPVAGPHNVANALAAATAAGFSEIDVEHIRNGLKNFKGLEHRLEDAGTINGITFINDSKATNIDALMVALRSFRKPVTLIAGGTDKGSDLSIASGLIEDKVKNLILIGEAAGRMESVWSDLVDTLTKLKSLHDAISSAFVNADEGDVILLSPGCASFDMFSSFEERGKVFKHIVKLLQKK